MSPALPGEFLITEPQGSPRKADEHDCSSLCLGSAWALGRVSDLSCTFLCKIAYMLWTQENLALNPSMAVRCLSFLIFIYLFFFLFFFFLFFFFIFPHF